jgi:peptide/nickel transport system substrate-binding protein
MEQVSVIRRRSALSSAAVILIVVVLIVAAIAAVYFVAFPAKTSTSAGQSSTSSTGVVTTSTTSTPTGPQRGGALVADELFEPGTIDPATTNTAAGEAIDANVVETLLSYNWTTKQIIPRLATSWNVTADGLTYTFHLRKGVYFVDPTTNKTTTQLNATDVKYSWTRVLPQANGYIFLTAGLNMSTFKILDPFTFSVSLSAPFSPFLPTVAVYFNGVISSTADIVHGGVTNGTVNPWAQSHLIGTGPFMMAEWAKGDHITLVRNPFYWGTKANLDKVIIYYKNDPSTRLLDIKGGAVQVANIDPNLVSSVSGTPGIVVKIIGLSDNIAPIGLNVHKFPTKIKLVRQAIVHAINYSFINNKIFAGFATSFAGPIPKGMFGHNDSQTPYQTDLALAKSLMAQAGFANGKFANGTALPPITFVYPFDWPSGGLVAAAVQSDLSKIGLQLNIEGATSVTFSALTSLNFTDPKRPEMMSFFWTPDYIDPADYAFPSTNYGSLGGYDNKTLETLGTQALHTANQTLEANLYGQITKIVTSDAPMVWTYQITGYSIYKSNVHGLFYIPLIDGYGFEYQQVWLG